MIETAPPAIPEIGKSITAMGLRTNYHDVGEGRPVVLLHGSGPGVSAWANWRLTMPVLAKQFRVIAIDLAGYGHTELDPCAVYTMDYWVAHLKAVLDALKLDKVAFVGNSFGGLLAVRFCLRYPERVSRIACMGANLLGFPIGKPLDELAWGYEPSRDNMKRLLEVFPYDKSIITDALVDGRYQASNRPAYQAAYAAMFPAPRQKVLDEMVLEEAQLSQLACETLLIHGREDAFVPLDVSVRAQAAIPRAQLHTFGQCGHWVQIEHSRTFCALLETFLGAQDAR
ncbi:alpha/beta fold hydrolase [Caenimonas soli]|uniref:alpha/beta fold hydrolase n=1 Tax=Caenimonas soli TaxID=2735555 RepID=UPI001554B9B0|nr:alpha/beta hydrolase [Caenimonas soli]NPC55909.1 alpha/beta fold hydrolase [Caenimonas soli]